MKLHFHPISTTSRCVLLFAADEKVDLEPRVVDLFTGEHLQPPYSALNPSQQVPVLEDGDFVLTESSAILKYLGDKVRSAAYPADLRERARINERLDWLYTGFSRDLLYGFVYPQIFPHHKRPDDAVQAATLAWHGERAARWLKILDENVIGPSSTYLCGDRISLADYAAIAMLTAGEIVHIDYSRWRNISRFVAAMKARPTFAPVHETFDKLLIKGLADKTFAPF
jgi:glutathione S-transferase